ncbi:uncharacterized protein LOC142769342 isoform X2 [Rhipicephalus microplus]
MMEEVEQDWRPYYDACYKRPPAAATLAMRHVDSNRAQASSYNEGLEMHAHGSTAKLVSFEKNSGPNNLGRKTSSILLSSLVLFVVGALCLTVIILIVVNLSNAARGGLSVDENSEVPKEVSLRLDAPQVPKPASSPRSAAAPAAKSKAKAPSGKQRKPSNQAPTKSAKKDNQVTTDKQGTGALENRQKNAPCGEPQQTYCPKSEKSYFYQYERDYCESTYREQVFVCNHSPNRFSSLKGCTNACIKNPKPFSRCQQQPVFTKCNRNDLKASFWYRENNRCVEWSYPDGYCATKLRGVARSLRECRDDCLGPGTSDDTCTLPAEYTCPPAEMKFPYFAYTFPNGTVVCLLADAERLRPHRCLVGENKYASKEACIKACSGNPETIKKRKKPEP